MILSALVLSAALSIRAPTQGESEFPDGNKLVKVGLLADHESIAPGSKFTLAVTYKIEPKWHIYWRNPGDSGLATRVKITAPAGFEVGEAQFPWPKRDALEGDIVTFIHEEELTLLVDVKAPNDLKPGAKVAFEAEGSWLVCTDLCVPGSGNSKLELATAAVEKPANAALFEAARKRLPRPWKELERARSQWSGDESAPRLTFIVPGATAVEFFPLVDETTHMTARTADAGKSGATLKAEFNFERKRPEDRAHAHGVLWVKTAQGESSYSFDELFPRGDEGR